MYWNTARQLCAVSEYPIFSVPYIFSPRSERQTTRRSVVHLKVPVFGPVTRDVSSTPMYSLAKTGSFLVTCISVRGSQVHSGRRSLINYVRGYWIHSGSGSRMHYVPGSRPLSKSNISLRAVPVGRRFSKKCRTSVRTFCGRSSSTEEQTTVFLVLRCGQQKYLHTPLCPWWSIAYVCRLGT